MHYCRNDYCANQAEGEYCSFPCQAESQAESRQAEIPRHECDESQGESPLENEGDESEESQDESWAETVGSFTMSRAGTRYYRFLQKREFFGADKCTAECNCDHYMQMQWPEAEHKVPCEPSVLEAFVSREARVCVVCLKELKPTVLHFRCHPCECEMHRVCLSRCLRYGPNTVTECPAPAHEACPRCAFCSY
jgi:hypothetical protein